MRLLAALLAGSGAAWIAGILLTNPHLVVPSVSPVLVLAACYVVVAAGVVLAIRRTSQLPGRLVTLWALAVIMVGLALSPVGVNLSLLGVVLLFGTIAFGLWMAPALLVFNFVRDFRRTSAPMSGSATQPPAA